MEGDTYAVAPAEFFVILMNEKTNIKEDAELLRLGLVTGYTAIDEVIKWADRLIMDYESLPHEIFDLSTSSHKNEVISILAKIRGKYDRDRVRNRYFGLLYDVLSEDKTKAREIAHRLYIFMFECGYELRDDIEHSIYYFDDGFDLAIQGIYGNVDNLTNELIEFLRNNTI